MRSTFGASNFRAVRALPGLAGTVAYGWFHFLGHLPQFFRICPGFLRGQLSQVKAAIRQPEATDQTESVASSTEQGRVPQGELSRPGLPERSRSRAIGRVVRGPASASVRRTRGWNAPTIPQTRRVIHPRRRPWGRGSWPGPVGDSRLEARNSHQWRPTRDARGHSRGRSVSRTSR